ncbi:MAG: UpxY family transcription antiterminator [Verrucomicrobiales bacterium]|nr:UpxY family transcription antiterminator [Verrucomicrobiales bacterium]
MILNDGQSMAAGGDGVALSAGGEAQEAALRWWVAHTKARCEKKLADYCLRGGIAPTLPLYKSVKKYRGKTVTFEKPLFPGYLFLRMSTFERSKVLQSDYLANLLDVPVQDEFEEQLGAILQALDTDYEVKLAPTIKPGCRVRIKSGPLRGLEGYVEQRRGTVEVHLRLDFISQAAAVRMDADLLELI